MIKANELRVGNVISERDNHRIYKVLEILSNGVRVKYWSCGETEIIPFSKIMPVQLTDEILEQLGFKKSCMYDWSKGNIEILYNDFDEAQLSINEGEYAIGQKIKYVHQLQNLYFALMGEELSTDLLNTTFIRGTEPGNKEIKVLSKDEI